MSTLHELWFRFRKGGEVRPLVRLAATAAAAMLLVGVGILVAWTVGMTRTNPAGTRVGWVFPQDVMKGIIGAGFVWLITIVWLWRPAVRIARGHMPAASPRFVVPLVIMVGIALVLVLLDGIVARKQWDAPRVLITAVGVLGAGLALVAWLPAIAGLEKGRPLERDGRISVRCPRCRYDMAGSHEARCSECGADFSIEELIREQRYEAHR